MIFQSTRGGAAAVGAQAVLRGLAPDGGLYVDPSLPSRPFDWRGCLRKPPLEAAEQILRHLLPGFEDMGGLVRRAYAGKFASPELTPLRPAGDVYLLELFHGPTSAFKDVALSMLPQLMTAARRQEGLARRIEILTATSGDTGKAALEGFRDVEGLGVTVFYPAGGVSPVQRAQMVTQEGRNVRVCAVRGNFDDCQRGVKDVFAHLTPPEGVLLSSANSINIGRLTPQVTYYFLAYAQLLRLGALKLGDPVDFSVPTGNFGDILAGYFAALMGLPVGTLICASNANRVLTDFLCGGVYDRRRVFYRTSSPSMDILVSSNLERLLYYASQGDCALVSECMEKLDREGVYALSGPALAHIQSRFAAWSCGEAETAAAIARLWREHGVLCDTHTAVAFHAAWEYRRERGGARPMVVLSTASPFKFPAAVLRALGGQPEGDEFEQMEALSRLSGAPIPANLRGLREKPVRHRAEIGPEELPAYVARCLAEGGGEA